MKKTYVKIIIDEIKSSFGRFIAIFSIVALSIGFLCGLLATTPDMTATANQYYNENNAADINIKATMGLTKEELCAVLGIEKIKEVMPAYVTDVLLEANNNEVLNAKLFGLPLFDDQILINNLKIVKGRMPKVKNECVVEKAWGTISNIELGTKLIVSSENKDYENISDIYSVLEYTVVGIVENTSYFSIESERSTIGNGNTNAIIYVDKSCYSLDVHTDFFIKVDGAEVYTAFTDEYENYVEETVDKLKELEKKQSEIRLIDIKTKAYDELNDAKKKYEDGKNEAETKLNDAAIKIEDGKKELNDAKKKIFDGNKEIEEAKITLKNEVEKAKKVISDGYLDTEEAKIKLDDGEIKYLEGIVDIKKGQKEYDDGLKDFSEAEVELVDSQKKFDDGEKEYLDGVKELEEGKTAIIKGSSKLSSARNQLEQAEIQYEQGKAELNMREAQFNALTNQVIISLATSPSAINFTSSEELYNALENDETGMINYAVTQILMGIKIAVGDPNLPDDAQGLILIRDTINGGKQQLAAAALEIADGWSQYNSGSTKLSKAKKEIKEAEDKLEDAKVELEENRQKLKDGWIELEDGRTDLEVAKVKLVDGYEELEDARIELDDGWIKYNDGLIKLADAEEELKTETAKAEKEIQDGVVDLAKGRKDYQEGLSELEENEIKYLDAKTEAEEKLNDAEVKIKDAEKEIAKLENPQWYVLDRKSNVSYASFSANATKVVPIFFFLIAALVTLTTMTRMVEEERTQIGTLKALGYKKITIISKYLIYSGLASIMGSIAGILIGFRLFPSIIWNAYRSMYYLPDLTNQFLWEYAVPESLFIILLNMSVTLYVSVSTLKEKPATLMLPRAPKAGKRIFLENINFIWSRMKFSHKSTARNIMRYKRHLFMTVIGIAGCSGLILTGFGLLDSIGSIANTQFTEIFKYNLNIELEDVEEYDSVLNIFLKDNSIVLSQSELFTETGYVLDGRDRISTSIKVPNDASSLMEV